MSSPIAGAWARRLGTLAARGGLAIVAITWAAGAGAQAVLWQRSPPALPVAWSGVGIAFPASGVVVAAGNTAGWPWIGSFATSGTPLDAAAAPAPPADGIIVTFDIRATALAPGFGGAILLGWSRSCTYIPPFSTYCTVPSPWISAYSAAAILRWSVSAAGNAAAAADGTRAYVVGGVEARLQQFDAAGTLLGDVPLLPGSGGAFLDVAAFPGGGAVAAGSSTAGPLLQRVGPNGQAAWPQTVVASLDPATRFEKVVVDPAGNAYVAGTREVAGGARDLVLARFGADGALAWTRTRTGVVPVRSAATDAVSALALDGANNVIVAATASTPIDMVAWTAKFDPDGDLLWTDVYATGPDVRMNAAAIGVDTHGQVYAGGTATRTMPPGRNGYVRKLGPGGTALWTARWEGRIADVAVGPGDEVMVLADLPQDVALMRLDPGAGEGAAPPTVLLGIPAGPPTPGMAVTLAASVRGTATPTGVVTFRVNGADACTNVPLLPSTAPVATAQCVLARGLPVGTALVEVHYGGDVANAAASASGRFVVAASAPTEIPALAPAGLLALGVLVAWGAGRNLRRS
jgi:hypothetical protein